MYDGFMYFVQLKVHENSSGFAWNPLIPESWAFTRNFQEFWGSTGVGLLMIGFLMAIPIAERNMSDNASARYRAAAELAFLA